MALALEIFVDQLCESGILPAAEVHALQAEHAPADSEQFARLLVRLKRLTAYQAKQVYAGKARALVLGNYLILEKLGQGGMGMVLKARHRRMDRIVALKVLSPAVVQDAEMMARFHREVKAAARLEHANIVIAFDADEANGTHFFVMQYVEGSDLSQVVKTKGTLPIDQAVNCVLQAARGLEFAHNQGVIHRDIKPANLLLDNNGVVKLLDLGLARIEGDTGTNADLTGIGEVMGTIDYMAPEQATNTKGADARCDIYSLGVTLWYLLVGRPMYEEASLMRRLIAHQESPIPSLRDVRGTVPRALELLFNKMVAKKPGGRYQSMTEVIAALEACQRDAAPPPLSGVAPRSEDSKLGEYLENFNAETMPLQKKVAQAGKSGRVQVNLPPSEQLTLHSGTAQVDTDVAPTIPAIKAEEASRSSRKRRNQPRNRSRTTTAWWQDRRVQLGGGAAALVVLLAVIFLRPAAEATLSVEIHDPQVELRVQGTDLEFKGAGPNSKSLTAGNQTLQVRRGNSAFDVPVNLNPGEETRVKIEWVGDNLLVKNDGHVLAKKFLKRNGKAVTTGSGGTHNPPATKPAVLTGQQLGELVASAGSVWGPVKNLGPGVNSGQDETMLRISDDELLLYFDRGGEGLMVSQRRRAGDLFGPATRLTELRIQPGGKDFSGDGLLFVHAQAENKIEVLSLSTRSRLSEPFGSPVRLEAPVKSEGQTMHPVLSSDGLTLLACSLREGFFGDVWMFTRDSRTLPFAEPLHLPAPANTSLWDMPQWISNDRCAVILSAQQDNHRYYRLLSRASVKEPFGNEQPLGTPVEAVDTSVYTGNFRLSLDGQRIYFNSPELPGGFGRCDLYSSRDTK